MDFNHTVDRIRVVNDGDENARLNPNNGARADATDTDLSPGGFDVAGAAYDRVDTDAATGTTLYGFAANTSELVTIGGINSTPSPNLGAVNVVGAPASGAITSNVERQLRHLALRHRRSSARSRARCESRRSTPSTSRPAR